MSKNQKETKKFPKMKVILSVVLACLFGFAAPFVETFTQAQAEAIKQGKYAPVPNTVVVQDLKALGSVRDLMQPSE